MNKYIFLSVLPIIMLTIHLEKCISGQIFSSEAITWQQMLDSSNVYHKAKDSKSAIQWALRAETKAREDYGNDDTLYVSVYNTIALLYGSNGKLNESIEYYKKCLNAYRKMYPAEHLMILTTLNKLIVLYQELGMPIETEPFMTEVLEIQKKMFKGDNPFVANSINNLGYINQLMGRLDKAESLIVEALEMQKRLFKGDNVNLATTMTNLATLYIARWKHYLAEPLLIDALEMYKRIYKGDNAEIARCLNNLANLYHDIGRLNDAEKVFTEALEMRKRLFKGDNISIALGLNNLAGVYDSQDRLSEAEQYYREAFEMRKRLFMGDHPDLAQSMNNIASICQSLGRIQESEQIYKLALEMYQRLYKGDNKDVARSLNNLGNIYQLSGKLEEAESLFTESMEMYKRLYKNKHPAISTIMNNLAILYNSKGKIKEAETLSTEAVDFTKKIFGGDHPEVATSMNNLSYIYIGQGRFNESEQLFKETLEMKKRIYNHNHTAIATSLFNMAGLYLYQNKISQSEPFFIESLSMFRDIYNNQSLFLSENEKEKYWNTIKKNFELFHSFIYKRSLENASVVCLDYNFLLYSKGILASSVNKMRKNILGSMNDSLISLFNNWVEMKKYISKNSTLTVDEQKKRNLNIDSLEQVSNVIEKNLSLKSSVFASEINKKLYKYTDVQSKLKKDEASIEIVRYRHFGNMKWTDTVHYAALIITNDKLQITNENKKLNVTDQNNVKFIVLENGNELETMYIKYYNKIISKQKEQFVDQAFIESGLKELYTNFWEKIAVSLVGIRKVYLAPDGVFNQINLSTLINPKTGKYLAEEMDIHLVTSTREIVEWGNKRTETPKFIALFGDPKYEIDEKQVYASKDYIQSRSDLEINLFREIDGLTRGGIPPLPGTKKEVESIKVMFSKKNWEIHSFLGSEASEENIKKLKNPGILHIATHGKFLKDEEVLYSNSLGMDEKRVTNNPLLRSFLFFAGAENNLRKDTARIIDLEDGLLTAYEATNLNLENTELVVLSACETGLGEVKNGEGVYGLQRAFIQAGAKSIIMSLWNVSDEATQELMSTFYKEWLGGKTKREAFKTAQIKLKEKYTFPYFWGAFVMVGE